MRNRSGKAASDSLVITLENGLDGDTFARQRALLLRLSDGYLLSDEDRELLEGVNNLLDSIADQAHEHQGSPCLMKHEHFRSDPSTHLREHALKSLPETLPKTREEMADLIAGLYAGGRLFGKKQG